MPIEGAIHLRSHSIPLTGCVSLIDRQVGDQLCLLQPFLNAAWYRLPLEVEGGEEINGNLVFVVDRLSFSPDPS